jgi:hypothetical protein
MKSSPRDLLLIGRTLGKKQRYYNLRSALKRAVETSLDRGVDVTIYDLAHGRDLVSVGSHPTGVNSYIHVSIRTFNRYWSR